MRGNDIQAAIGLIVPRSPLLAVPQVPKARYHDLVNFHGLGRLLVSMRIFRGMTQRDLSIRLGVHESQVSRDERNEYHGITVSRAARIFEILGARLHTTVEAVDPREDELLAG